jgi:hypothetical protein
MAARTDAMTNPTIFQQIWDRTPIVRRYSISGERAISIQGDGRMNVVPLTELSADEIGRAGCTESTA